MCLFTCTERKASDKRQFHKSPRFLAMELVARHPSVDENLDMASLISETVVDSGYNQPCGYHIFLESLLHFPHKSDVRINCYTLYQKFHFLLRNTLQHYPQTIALKVVIVRLSLNFIIGCWGYTVDREDRVS
jgi:hypothetical protein